MRTTADATRRAGVSTATASHVRNATRSVPPLPPPAREAVPCAVAGRTASTTPSRADAPGSP